MLPRPIIIFRDIDEQKSMELYFLRTMACYKLEANKYSESYPSLTEKVLQKKRRSLEK